MESDPDTEESSVDGTLESEEKKSDEEEDEPSDVGAGPKLVVKPIGKKPNPPVPVPVAAVPVLVTDPKMPVPVAPEPEDVALG